MRSLAAGILVLLGTGLPAHGYPQQAAPIQKAPGKKPASYELRANFSSEKRLQILAEIREQLWLTWRQHQPIQIAVAEYEPGRESHTTYTFGADSDGIWQLTIDSKSVVADPWYPNEKYHQQSVHHVYTVERMPNAGKYANAQVRLPVEADFPPDSYHLVMLDKAGVIVQNL